MPYHGIKSLMRSLTRNKYICLHIYMYLFECMSKVSIAKNKNS